MSARSVSIIEEVSMAERIEIMHEKNMQKETSKQLVLAMVFKVLISPMLLLIW